MTNISITCPFSKKVCTDCVLYRGRHHYLSLLRPGRRVADKSEKPAESGLRSLSDDFEVLIKSSDPWAGKYGEVRWEPKISLKVIDVENGGEQICTLGEARKWDWTNSKIWRVIDGRQIKSLDSLIEILSYKAEEGLEEVDLYEAPRFMLLAGG